MNRRSKPPNRFGCKPDEDVCVEHDVPLACRHGCEHAKPHECADLRRQLAEAERAPTQEESK